MPSTIRTVTELEKQGVILVQDGNHGEYRPRKNEFCDEGVAFIRAADLDNGNVLFESASKINPTARARITKGVGKPGDVILSHKGTVGKLARAPDNCPSFVCSPQTTFWRSLSPDVLDQTYLYVFLRSPVFTAQLNARAGETDMAPYVSLTAQRAFAVTLPQIEEQRAIAEIIGRLDDKIDLNRRMNETLEAQARALFRDWFVDFGPVKAKMAGDTPYLTPDLWSLFPNRLDDDGVPEGWGRSTVGASFNLTMGQSPPGDTYNDDGEGLPFFQGRTDFGFRYPENRKYCDAPKRVAEAEDTLVSVRAPVGDINLAWEKSCVGRGLAALRHKSGSPSFTYYSAAALRSELEIYQHTGTVFGAINKKQFEALKTVEPDVPMLKAFDELVGPLDQKIRTNELESRTLTQTRDLLLPKLMSGEIRVGDLASDEFSAA